MNEDRDRIFENSADKASLDEKELESVSGGFELPTIIDTCQNRWIPGICNAIWGKCPHLTMTETSRKTSGINPYVIFSVSCGKGCFANLEYKRDESYKGS